MSRLYFAFAWHWCCVLHQQQNRKAGDADRQASGDGRKHRGVNGGYAKQIAIPIQ